MLHAPPVGRAFDALVSAPAHTMRLVTSLARAALLAALVATPLALHAQPQKPAKEKPKGTVVNATCNDGSLYSGTSKAGACSGHGGVKAWADGSKAPRPKNATALCKDGSWHTKAERRGACGQHGGVQEWVKP